MISPQVQFDTFHPRTYAPAIMTLAVQLPATHLFRSSKRDGMNARPAGRTR